jgi:hypothetical protein
MLDEYFKNLNRSAVVIKPQQPFINWLKSLDPEIEEDEEMMEGEIYLLPDYETKEEMENWLKKNFNALFSEQLNNWFVDETMWPQNRTFKMFTEWFSYSFHTMIFDTQKGLIEKI